VNDSGHIKAMDGIPLNVCLVVIVAAVVAVAAAVLVI
jgi:hypothetical protein